MPKLIDDHETPKQAIGEDGLLRFIDEMNRNRAQKGVNERYQPVRRDGALSFEPHYPFKWKDRFSPSPHYAKPRLVHWQDREPEPA